MSTQSKYQQSGILFISHQKSLCLSMYVHLSISAVVLAITPAILAVLCCDVGGVSLSPCRSCDMTMWPWPSHVTGSCDLGGVGGEEADGEVFDVCLPLGWELEEFHTGPVHTIHRHYRHITTCVSEHSYNKEIISELVWYIAVITNGLEFWYKGIKQIEHKLTRKLFLK